MKSAIRSYTKKVLSAVEAKDQGKASTGLRIVAKHLDKAAKRGVIHRRTADRNKSRLARMVAKLGAPAA